MAGSPVVEDEYAEGRTSARRVPSGTRRPVRTTRAAGSDRRCRTGLHRVQAVRSWPSSDCARAAARIYTCGVVGAWPSRSGAGHLRVRQRIGVGTHQVGVQGRHWSPDSCPQPRCHRRRDRRDRRPALGGSGRWGVRSWVTPVAGMARVRCACLTHYAPSGRRGLVAPVGHGPATLFRSSPPASGHAELPVA